ncbi:MAG: hypothetical protein GX363_09845 [Clostridiales bacterium]|jgi:uncharacterized membrane protein YkvI|nr:hypothetical protein [Clostridiales bacterium]
MTRSDSDKLNLSFMRIAFLYFGVLMGAGFASGKEMWQFFGVFGGLGFFGILLIIFLFIALGIIIVYISSHKNTGDLSKIISPFDNHTIERIIGIIIAAFLFMAYFSMLAAGGALIQEQFGVNRLAGSIILMFIIIIITVRGFGRVSSFIGKIVPVLLVFTLALSLIILAKDYKSISFEQIIDASPLAQNWFISAIVFVSYNIMGAIPILGSCTIHSENRDKAILGAVIGGIFLGICALILYLVTLTDPILSNKQPLPMLTLSHKILPNIQAVYSLVLFISILGTAISCFYGYTTKLADNSKKKYIILISAVAGFGFSLLGFSNIVAIIYPIEGYIGLLFLLLMTWNFVHIKREKYK